MWPTIDTFWQVMVGHVLMPLAVMVILCDLGDIKYLERHPNFWIYPKAQPYPWPVPGFLGDGIHKKCIISSRIGMLVPDFSSQPYRLENSLRGGYLFIRAKLHRKICCATSVYVPDTFLARQKSSRHQHEWVATGFWIIVMGLQWMRTWPRVNRLRATSGANWQPLVSNMSASFCFFGEPLCDRWDNPF